MKILVADDDRVTRRMLEVILGEWGYETVLAADGTAAWDILRGDDMPPLAVLDVLMPGVDGLELCRRVRAEPALQGVYVILLTVNDSPKDVVAGLDGGADDYITKPFNLEELRARVQTGVRIVRLQQRQAEQVRLLAEALARVRQLQGLLPICSYCKRIRDDQDYWQQLETYITAHSNAQFSHGICPACWETRVAPELQAAEAEAEAARQGAP